MTARPARPRSISKSAVSGLQWLRFRLGPILQSIELGAPVGRIALEVPVAAEADRRSTTSTQPTRADGSQASEDSSARPAWSPVWVWLFNDVPYIAMLLLALAGILLRLPVTYWIILTPIFGLITIIEGWSHFTTRDERVGLTLRVAAIWCALLLSVYLLYNTSVQGVMNANATSLTMIVLLALGTFVAGIQAHVWQICTVGALLFLSVPGVGWLDNSPLLLAAVTIIVVLAGGFLWWFKQFQSGLATEPKSAAPVPPIATRAE